MIEITNVTRGPVQVLIKTGPGRPKGLAVLNIPGIGAGKNVVELADERHTEYVDQSEQAGLIKQKRINKKAVKSKRGE